MSPYYERPGRPAGGGGEPQPGGDDVEAAMPRTPMEPTLPPGEGSGGEDGGGSENGGGKAEGQGKGQKKTGGTGSPSGGGE
jgi:hypothetical protein